MASISDNQLRFWAHLTQELRFFYRNHRHADKLTHAFLRSLDVPTYLCDFLTRADVDTLTEVVEHTDRFTRLWTER